MTISIALPACYLPRHLVVCAAALFAAGPALAGTLSVVHSFTGGADGATPYKATTLDSLGNAYGETFYGAGACPDSYTYAHVGCGTVYKIDTSGVLTTLVHLQGQGERGGRRRQPHGQGPHDLRHRHIPVAPTTRASCFPSTRMATASRFCIVLQARTANIRTRSRGSTRTATSSAKHRSVAPAIQVRTRPGLVCYMKLPPPAITSPSMILAAAPMAPTRAASSSTRRATSLARQPLAVVAPGPACRRPGAG